MAESKNLGSSQSQESNQNSSQKSESTSSSKDFFNLSKTCGDNCSIAVLIIMILLTLIFFGILIYCKFFRKSTKTVKNIVVQVKAISINQSVLEHVRSLSEKNMKLGIKNGSQQQIYPLNESAQGDARTQIQMEQDYKNFLHNQALNNIANGKQMLEYDNSVQFYKESQQNNYLQEFEQQNNPHSYQGNNNQDIDQKKIVVSQMQMRKDQNFSQNQLKRFVKSEQGNYVIDNQSMKENNQRNNSSLSNRQQVNTNNKKSGLVLNENQSNSANLQNFNKIMQKNQSTDLQSKNARNINESQQKYGKIRLASLNQQIVKHQMETVKEEQNEQMQNTKTLETNNQYRRKLLIQKQIQNDPSILDSSLNSSVQNPEHSMYINNSILNQLQFSCKNQSSKLLGEYLEEQNINNE